MPPISDDELNLLLREWKPLEAPRGLEARVHQAFEKQKPLSWRWWLSGTLSIPVPVGAAAVVLMAGFAVALLRISIAPVPPPRIVIQTRTVEVPVVRDPPSSTALHPRRGASEPAPAVHRRRTAIAVLNLNGFEPVTNLRAQIVRRSHDE